jgi:hypothetical protein
MKKCPYCGKECPDEALVCDIDGEPLQPPSLVPQSIPEVKTPVKGLLDPLIWCAACFLISVVAYWWPAATHAGPQGSDDRIGMVYIGLIWIIAPLVTAAGVRAIFACRELFHLARGQNEVRANLAALLGLIFTVLTVLTATWLLFIFLLFIPMLFHR